jgi:xylulokinase
VNGTGILNSWLKKTLSAAGKEMDYAAMNDVASKVAAGSDGLLLYPFGNGAERILGNREVGASMQGIDFHNHGAGHLTRAAQEGIVFALFAGIEIMQECGMQIGNVKAGMANMFLSPVFREVFCAVGKCSLTMLESDGSQGAARGAGVGLGLYSVEEGAQLGLKKLAEMEPKKEMVERYAELYAQWKMGLEKQLR